MSNSLQQTPDAPEYRGWKIRDILRSGNHAHIERTRQRRPDLLPPDVG